MVMIDGKPLFGTKEQLGALGVTAMEDLPICSAPRELNAEELRAQGFKPFGTVKAELVAAMKQEGTSLASLADCPAKPGR